MQDAGVGHIGRAFTNISSISVILNHWGRVTHICVGNLTTIGSDNGLSPGRRQAIIWTNAGILSIGHLGRNFSEFLIEIHTFSFKKMHLKRSSGKWRPFCLGLNVLTLAHVCKFIRFDGNMVKCWAPIQVVTVEVLRFCQILVQFHRCLLKTFHTFGKLFQI